VTQTITLVTTAPETYDGFGTQTVAWLPYRSRLKGESYRLVSVRSDAINWQTARYGGGKYPAMPRDEFDTWVDLGLVEPTGNGADLEELTESVR